VLAFFFLKHSSDYRIEERQGQERSAGVERGGCFVRCGILSGHMPKLDVVAILKLQHKKA
jgi:hypothetical protein